jgi:uncharacterized protein YjeT (DUF2065 family)
MIAIIGALTIISGLLYFLACDNIGKTLITENELLATKVLLAVGICTMSVGLVLGT